MADTAEHAWGHCLAVLRDSGPAEEVAIVAVRRGGRSRTATLAQARALSLARAAAQPPPEPDLDERLPEELDALGLAVLLAGLRPALERCLIDLDGRLDRVHLGRALGLTPAAAASRVADTAARWERELDPALVAWLGPGECAELAELLGDDRPATLGEAIALAPVVTGHVDGCEVCSDRRRAMVSVRALQAQGDVHPLPAGVRAAAGVLPRPNPWPDSIDGPRRRRRRLPWAASAALLVALGAVLVISRDHRSHPQSALLTSVNGLTVSPASLAADGLVSLRDTTTHPVSWQATPSAGWLTVDPTSGRLVPGQTVVLRISFLSGAPPGGARGTIGVAGSDGSAAQVDATAPLVQNPDLAATAEGCTVRAQVVDPTDATVTLHYRVGSDPTVHDAPFAGIAGPGVGAAGAVPPATGQTSTLPAGPRPVTWWVTAIDRAGGQARTLDQTALLSSC